MKFIQEFAVIFRVRRFLTFPNAGSNLLADGIRDLGFAKLINRNKRQFG